MRVRSGLLLLAALLGVAGAAGAQECKEVHQVEMTFDGEIPYTCGPHPPMVGKIVGEP